MSSAQVVDHQKISDIAGLFDIADEFGSSVFSLGDMDGDGISDLAVGATGDDDDGFDSGAVWVLFLHADGSVKAHEKISSTSGGFTGILDNGDEFGSSVSSLGDMDGDGISDLAVGARLDDDGGSSHGAVWVLFLNAGGSVKAHQKISSTSGGFTGTLDNGDEFGSSVFSLGDMDGDGIPDLAVGAAGDDDGGSSHGAVWVLFLNGNGSVKAHQKISSTSSGLTSILAINDRFGSSVSSLGDIDGDGIPDLVVGAWGDDDGGSSHGAVWVLFLHADGSVKAHQKISSTSGGFTGNLDEGDLFGSSVSSLGDINGDGIPDLAVGARLDDDGGFDSGAVWVLFLHADGSVKAHQKLSSTLGGFNGNLDDGDLFGSSVSSLGDMDGDGIPDLVVGAWGDNDGGFDSGAVWVLYLNADGSVKAHLKISSTSGGFTGNLDDIDRFGHSVSSLRDMDGDGIPDLAVGVAGDDDGGPSHGAVWVLFLNADGSVKAHQKISSTLGNFTGNLDNNDEFGSSVSSLGDMDGDGIHDLAVGAWGDDDGGLFRGAVWVLFLHVDGSVKAHQKISSMLGGFTGNLEDNDRFGSSVSSLGDMDGDGISDLAVGARLDDDGGFDRGAVWVLFLNADGSVKAHQKISSTSGGFNGNLDDNDLFGSSVTSLGDLDGDGIPDLAVGARLDDDGGFDRGAVWVLFLNADGSVKAHRKISNTTGGFNGNLDDSDRFGISVSSLGDMDADGIPDLAVGAILDDDGGFDRGAVWVLYLHADGSVKAHQKISGTSGGFNGNLDDNDRFGSSVTSLGDVDGDDIPDLAVGARLDDDGGFDRGAVWVLFFNAAPTFDKTALPTKAVSNQDIRIATDISDFHGVREAKIEFRRGGDPQSRFSSRSMIRQASNLWENTIPEGIVTDRGIEFFLTAEDALGLISREPESGLFEIRVDVSNKRMSASFAFDSYRLFSVPLDLVDKSPEAVLEDDLGPYDPTIWRFFEPTPGESPATFLEYSNIEKIISGKSYWLINEKVNTFIGTGPGVSNSTAKPFKIPLEAGWNYIGNPYTFSIPESNLTLGSGAPLNIQTYDDAGWHSVSTIEPFEGYIVASDLEADTLYIKAEVSDDVGKTSKKEKEGSDAVWAIRLAAKSASVENGESIVAISKASDDEWDLLDRPAPPQPMGDYVSVYFPHPEWQKYFQRYSVDTRPLNQKGEVWDFEVTTSVHDLVNLSFDGIEDVPSEFEVWLVDEAVNLSQNLREVNAYTIAGPLEHQPKQLKLVVGKTDYVEEQRVISAELPNDFQLSQNFPNPFSFTTTIPYALPKPAPVTLTVYSILGERVATILLGEEKPTGYHAAIWDGRNDAGAPAASGLYFIKLHAGIFNETQTTIKLK